MIVSLLCILTMTLLCFYLSGIGTGACILRFEEQKNAVAEGLHMQWQASHLQRQEPGAAAPAVIRITQRPAVRAPLILSFLFSPTMYSTG